MTNLDVGRKGIRKLPDRPLIGERYSNAGSVYEVLSLNTEGDKAKVRRPKDGWCCIAHGPALYEMQDSSIELQWNYSTNGHWDE